MPRAQTTRSLNPDYYDTIAQMARRQNGGQCAYNAGGANAVIVLERLFKIADDSVKIVAEDLAGLPYGHPIVIKAALEFLGKPGTHIEIYSRASIDINHPLLAAMRPHGLQRRVLCWEVPEGVPQYTFNCMLADTGNIRLNEPIDKTEAEVRFGNNRIGMEKYIAIGEIQRQSRQISLPADPAMGVIPRRELVYS